MDYSGADGTNDGEEEKPWTNEDRLALANRDANKFPVYKVKEKEAQFRQRFSIPLIKKDIDSYNSFRPAPTLGMRRGAVFVAKPLHDPSGEFAIVLFDPTVDSKLVAEEVQSSGQPKPELDVPLMHKSLAEILGIKKQVTDEQPKVPVVIDPRLARVLRPHQVEGVKVSNHDAVPLHKATLTSDLSSYIAARLVLLTKTRMAVSWLTRWALARLCNVLLSCGRCSNNRPWEESPPSRSVLLHARQAWSETGRTSLVSPLRATEPHLDS